MSTKRPRPERQVPLPELPEPRIEFIGEVPISRVISPLARLLVALDGTMASDEGVREIPIRSAERRSISPMAELIRIHQKLARRFVRGYVKAQQARAAWASRP